MIGDIDTPHDIHLPRWLTEGARLTSAQQDMYRALIFSGPAVQDVHRGDDGAVWLRCGEDLGAIADSVNLDYYGAARTVSQLIARRVARRGDNGIYVLDTDLGPPPWFSDMDDESL